MPGPGAKNRNKKTGKGGKGTNNAKQSLATPSPQSHPAASASAPTKATISGPGPPCYTLLEDEMTRCGEVATVGRHDERRCKMHHSQYITMYKKYKSAGEKVDSIKNAGHFPNLTEIRKMKDRSEVIQKLKWLASYVEAIRIERYGRKIHSGRFFLKADAGHKTRINILAKEMEKANQLRKELAKQALDLHAVDHPEAKWTHPWETNTNIASEMQEDFDKTRAGFSASEFTTRRSKPSVSGDGSVPGQTEGGEDTDLIELAIHAEKRTLLEAFAPMLNHDDRSVLYKFCGINGDHEISRYMSRIFQVAMAQYLRRAAFYDDTLYHKTLDKVSFDDLFLSQEFQIEDAITVAVHLKGMTGFGLPWLKDSVVEAVEIVRRGDENISAQLGNMASRINILGGWIYTQRYSKKVSDEVWWFLYAIADIEPNTENRMVRLCNCFDDLSAFLSVAAFRPKPGAYPPGRLASSVPRMHLSISGIVIADMVSPPPILDTDIIATPFRPARPGNTVWGELQIRSHLFGAVRHDNDPFTEKFLAELQGRPDLFQLVIWDETQADAVVQEYGSGEGGKALPQMRARNFEAPTRSGPPSEGRGPWNMILRPARDILFAPRGDLEAGILPGYITLLRQQEKGWFFRFKSPSIPVRYIVILDTTPNRDVDVLSLHVAWMALRAGGYGVGEFTQEKYYAASDRLFEKEAKRRLSWQPTFFGGWSVSQMASEPDESSATQEDQQGLKSENSASKTPTQSEATASKDDTPRDSLKVHERDEPEPTSSPPEDELESTTSLGMLLAGAAELVLGFVTDL
ncbi:hypothetical protein BKA70DRAFT_7862 [Coprinopsis sp. MPI-PUGE-AT-0042]|nr:hypothetical protein BKA70DRAFT_7862 [Coprinopsis sp. MPI-PUGE-AT-0042]